MGKTKQKLLEQLEELKVQKKSKAYYAQKLNITEAEVQNLLDQLKKPEFDSIKEFDVSSGVIKSTVITDKEPKNDQELAKLHNVDLKSYKIDHYYSKYKGGKYESTIHSKLIDGSDFYSSEEFEIRLKQIFKNSTPVKRNKTVYKSDKALFIYISDDHAGTVIKDSIYDQEYNQKVYETRLDQVIQEIDSLDQKWSKVFVINLGDELDGYNGKTTRYDHDLGSLSNKEQFDMYTIARKKFYDQLFSSNVANEYHVINLNNSNHSGNGFSYIANRALEFYTSGKYPNASTTHQSKFIDTVKWGNHVIGLTHGKDEKFMKSPMPLNLDHKTDIWLMDYYKKHILENNWISTIKGDIHKFNINYGKSGRYVNAPSISSGSMWIEHNYGRSKSGVLLEIVDKNKENITSIPIWFN